MRLGGVVSNLKRKRTSNGETPSRKRKKLKMKDFELDLSKTYNCALYCGDADDDYMINLPKCTHKLHGSCLEGLLNRRLGKCPLCRESLDRLRLSRHYKNIRDEIKEQERDELVQAIRLSLNHDAEYDGYEVKDEDLEKLRSMGFDNEDKMRDALRASHGNIDVAVNFLITSSSNDHPPPPIGPRPRYPMDRDDEPIVRFDRRSIRRSRRNTNYTYDRQTGTCIWFSMKLGYGFIYPDSQDPDIFVHHTSLGNLRYSYRSHEPRAMINCLFPGQRVTYRISRDAKGRKHAQEVIRADTAMSANRIQAVLF